MKKKSNLLLLFMGISGLVGLGLYASHIIEHVEPKPIFKSRTIEIVDGDDFSEELELSYQHVHISFPTVSIDGRYSDHLELTGFEVAKDMAMLDVCNDTLYITYSEEFTPKYVGSDTEVALKIHVGGQSLKSITVADEGSINTPIKPLGMSKDGTTVYNQSDLDRYTLVFDSLTISEGPVNMILDGAHVNVQNHKRSSTNFVFRGTLNSIDVDYSKGGFFRMDAKELACQHAVVNGRKNMMGNTLGTIILSLTESLEANLYGPLDVTYYGDPHVEKYERSIGRVIHQHETEE